MVVFLIISILVMFFFFFFLGCISDSCFVMQSVFLTVHLCLAQCFSDMFVHCLSGVMQMHILGCSLQEEKLIRTVKESREMEKTYKGMFDEIIVNDDFETTYSTICRLMNELDKQHKWVPVDWND